MSSLMKYVAGMSATDDDEAGAARTRVKRNRRRRAAVVIGKVTCMACAVLKELLIVHGGLSKGGIWAIECTVLSRSLSMRLQGRILCKEQSR